MKELSSTGRTTLESVISENLKIEYTKIKSSKGVSLTGSVKLDGKEVGSVYYECREDMNRISIGIKDASSLTAKQRMDVTSTAMSDINELVE